MLWIDTLILAFSVYSYSVKKFSLYLDFLYSLEPHFVMEWLTWYSRSSTWRARAKWFCILCPPKLSLYQNAYIFVFKYKISSYFDQSGLVCFSVWFRSGFSKPDDLVAIAGAQANTLSAPFKKTRAQLICMLWTQWYQ